MKAQSLFKFLLAQNCDNLKRKKSTLKNQVCNMTLWLVASFSRQFQGSS